MSYKLNTYVLSLVSQIKQLVMSLQKNLALLVHKFKCHCPRSGKVQARKSSKTIPISLTLNNKRFFLKVVQGMGGMVHELVSLNMKKLLQDAQTVCIQASRNRQSIQLSRDKCNSRLLTQIITVLQQQVTNQN